jgi:uncharacterized repeat protein (TIGR01451 family)
MKARKHLLIVPIAGLLCLTSCSTSSPEPPRSIAVKPPAAVGSTSSYLVTLQKNAPGLVTIGEEFSYDLNVTAKDAVAAVNVMDTLPDGATFVSAEPAATKEGNRLTWNLGDLNQGESKNIKVTLKADKEGELVDCATVSALPRVCVTTMVGRPNLEIKKSGPEMAMVGQEIAYSVVVQNNGTTVAKEVAVIDNVPEGLSSANGERELTFNIGDLAPGASKTVSIPLKAAKRGKVVNTATASSGKAGKVTAEAQTTIVQQGVKIEKTTKDESLYVNRTAAYDIVVSNIGDTDLSGVVVTDTAAPETVIAAAEGATVTGSTAVWNAGDLKAGGKKSFAVKVLSKVPGKFTDTASVTTAQGLKDSTQASSEWKGITGVLVEMMDNPDPIQVGETTQFTIRVSNQGSTVAIGDLNIVATVPDELEVIASTVVDGGVISGKTITWPTVPSVAPKTSVVRTYSVKGVKVGDARSKASVTTSQRKIAIEQVESTTVY